MSIIASPSRSKTPSQRLSRVRRFWRFCLYPLIFALVDGHGKSSWPISGYTHLILPTTSMTDCAKAQKLLEYIHWTLTNPCAGERAAQRGYTVLPPIVRNLVLARPGDVTCNGQPVGKAAR